MVVLVDEGTASAAEIVAGALRTATGPSSWARAPSARACSRRSSRSTTAARSISWKTPLPKVRVPTSLARLRSCSAPATISAADAVPWSTSTTTGTLARIGSPVALKRAAAACGRRWSRPGPRGGTRWPPSASFEQAAAVAAQVEHDPLGARSSRACLTTWRARRGRRRRSRQARRSDLRHPLDRTRRSRRHAICARVTASSRARRPGARERHRRPRRALDQPRAMSVVLPASFLPSTATTTSPRRIPARLAGRVGKRLDHAQAARVRGDADPDAGELPSATRWKRRTPWGEVVREAVVEAARPRPASAGRRACRAGSSR